MGKKSRRVKTGESHSQPKFKLNAVFEPDQDIGFVYSYNNKPGSPEFVALKVHRCQANKVAKTMNFLSNRIVKHAQSIQSNELHLITNAIEGPQKEELNRTHCCQQTKPDQELFELVPRFPFDDPQDWGSRPAAPQGRQKTVDSILEVWTSGCDNGAFMRHINGDTLDDRPANLEWVDLAAALRHMDDWKVDWVVGLTAEEVAFVKRHKSYFVKMAKLAFRGKPICHRCQKVERPHFDEHLMGCASCKRTLYCSAECQTADWPDHKAQCKKIKKMLGK